ncbi:SAM-dependent methyltransferase [Streptococcus suis]|uniref:SAM-dependent methyltransferase n=1 Tax=Streptococcus suis TaxID=1307 RepID=A0A0Z8J9W3_STRSU|nr:SAM-dependent methyltransferase [Streptococcus suis]CYV53716.1 SAM-dependent methyltransferase [Streptococcus suis]
MIVTTSLGMDEGLVYRARLIASELGIEYKERKKQSVGKMLGTYEAVLVLYKDKLILEQRGGQVLFFHPDTAMLRIKSGRDPLLELLGKEKQSIIDCTMGLGSDSIVLASAGHRVTALESSKLVHFIVSRGLQDFDSGLQEVNRAMKSIQTIWTDSLTYLKGQIDKSVDVVYFDPMFSEEIKESQNLSGLSTLADRSRLTEEIVSEAKRVARKKLIIKLIFEIRSLKNLALNVMSDPIKNFTTEKLFWRRKYENHRNRL